MHQKSCNRPDNYFSEFSLISIHNIFMILPTKHLHVFSDDELFIGDETEKLLTELLDDGDITPYQMKKFYDGARAFYKEAARYACKNLPMHDKVLQNATWVNFEKRDDAKFEQVEFFIKRQVCFILIFEFIFLQKCFCIKPRILNRTQKQPSLNIIFSEFMSKYLFFFPNRFSKKLSVADGEKQQLKAEFRHFQSLDRKDIPKRVWDNAELDCLPGHYRMDVIWSYLNTVTDPLTKVPLFKRIGKVAKLVLVLPHSNAGEERVFSMVNQNKVRYRG